MKTCKRCQEEKPESEFYRQKGNKDGLQSWCKVCSRLQTNQWREANRERSREIDRNHRINRRAEVNARQREAYRRNPQRYKAAARKLNQELKDAAYQAYGGYRCSCCGETEPMFLCLDHINNDGHEHRKTVKAYQLYRWLQVQGYPEGFQVLCHNCNAGKRLNGGICPHQVKNGADTEAVLGLTVTEFGV